MNKRERDILIVETLKKVFIKFEVRNEVDIDDNLLLIGVLSNLINNKKIFKKNNELAEFLEIKFEIKFAEYCKKSRPLMIGKTIKYLIDSETNSSENINTLYRVLNDLLKGSLEDLTWTDIIRKIDIKGD